MSDKIRLTTYAHGAGCGCKIAPQVLQEILQHNQSLSTFPNLLVGNGRNDDAAVYDLKNGQALIATTDFFTPIVDDAYDFGRIAAANAISDVYAMGGQPIMAIAILGFPIDKLPVAIAQQILAGARAICEEAGIPLAGGHTIDSPEPIFGLSVNGLVATNQLLKNNTAQVGDYLLLTKPLGVGILATAEKRQLLQAVHEGLAVQSMAELNKIGMHLGAIEGVHALTDVTGFGLAGHLLELCEGSGCSAELYWNNLPMITDLNPYLQQNCIPDATYRNWNGYSTKIAWGPGVPVMQGFQILPDPQTSGGLLIAVAPDALKTVQDYLIKNGKEAFSKPIGQLKAVQEKTILVSLELS
jgi:selenide,water dikinase